MNCLEARSCLDDHLDGEFGQEPSRRLREHLAGCAACARHERALRGLIDEAAALPQSVDPPRDLWPGIDERIDAAERGEVVAATGRRQPWLQTLVAASVFLVAVAVGYVAWRGSPQPPSGGASPGFVVSSTDSASRTIGSTSETRDAERAFLEAKQALRAALDERRGSLSPETVAMIDRNLEIIEQSIAEISAALERDPSNRQLGRMLIAAHRREIDVLQHITQQASRL